MATKNKPEFYWHVHHDVLVEWCYDYQGRRVYIEREKPGAGVETRLRLFQPVCGALPGGVDWQKADADWQKAYVDWQKADADRQKAYADWQKADADRQKAYADWQKADADWQKACAGEIQALHRIECPDCPWDGHTIFPDKKE